MGIFGDIYSIPGWFKEVIDNSVGESLIRGEGRELVEGKGWPPGFFEQTYGSCLDDPIVIDFEGYFEEREEIL